MSLSFDERKAVVEFRIEKARRAFEQAQGVVELQYWETIANRLYYAAYKSENDQIDYRLTTID